MADDPNQMIKALMQNALSGASDYDKAIKHLAEFDRTWNGNEFGKGYSVHGTAPESNVYHVYDDKRNLIRIIDKNGIAHPPEGFAETDAEARRVKNAAVKALNNFDQNFLGKTGPSLGGGGGFAPPGTKIEDLW